MFLQLAGGPKNTPLCRAGACRFDSDLWHQKYPFPSMTYKRLICWRLVFLFFEIAGRPLISQGYRGVGKFYCRSPFTLGRITNPWNSDALRMGLRVGELDYCICNVVAKIENSIFLI
jgi:hypothetical protein